MTRKHSSGPKATRYATLALMLVAIAGLGVYGTLMLSVESAQAQSLIAQGKTDLQQSRRGEAMVSFERAQLLAPRADFVRSALRDAGARNTDMGAVELVHWLAPREWSVLLTIFGWVAGLSLAIAIALRENGRMARRVALVAGLLCALSAAGVVQSDSSARALRVVSSATGLLIAPYQGASAIADLRAGVVVTIGSRYGDFIQVRGPNGARGWVTENALESVVGA